MLRGDNSDSEILRPLDEIRQDIDLIDQELVTLLSRRTDLAIEVGKIKGRDGKPFFTPERERAIYERLAAINPGPLLPKQLKSIYREIISAAIAAEKPLTVAYWGPQGTFTNMAALQTFGKRRLPHAALRSSRFLPHRRLPLGHSQADKNSGDGFLYLPDYQWLRAVLD